MAALKRLIILTLSLVIGLYAGGIKEAATMPDTQPNLPENPNALSQRLYIPIIAKGLHANYWKAVYEGVQRAARDFDVNITFEGTEEEGQIEKQLAILRGVLARNPSAIAFSSIDLRAAEPYLQEAESRGIPVIGLDSGVVSPIVRTTVATDNYGAGSLAATRMADLLDGTGKAAIIVQDATSEVATDRRDGFVDTITQRYPGLEIVEIGYGKGEPQLSADLTKEIIAKHPGIRGIFGGNEGSAHGVILAIRDIKPIQPIVVIGFDSGKILMDAIREGLVAGAVTQNPRGMGYRTVETALRAYRGESLPAFIDTGYFWYDRFNIDTPEIREMLYE